MLPYRGIGDKAIRTGLEVFGLIAIDGVPLNPPPTLSFRNKSIHREIPYT